MDVAARLGEVLREAGFAGERHISLARMPGGVPPVEVLASLDRPEDARLAILLALFQHDETVPPAEVERAILPLAVEDLIEVGLMETDGSGVRARVRLAVFDDLLVAGDPTRNSDNANYVVSVSAASMRVGNVTVRRQVGTALDLGTGSGVQALLAARHAERVIGVDVNSHALSLAAVSQRLNGLENVTWVEGDWLEPVRGQRFDLVVANPAVIISPDNALLYRDSEVGGHELSRLLVRESAEHLAEGGYATVLCHWTHPEGAWEVDPNQWVAGLGCDALLLHFGSQEPLGYALINVTDRPSPTIADTLKRWTDHYRRAGVEQMSAGVIILRRRSAGSNWTRAFQIDDSSTGQGGDQLERVFAGVDFLESSGEGRFRRLLSTAWRLVDGHRLDHVLVYENGAYSSAPAVMRQEPGIRLNAQVDPRVVPVVVACDGQRPLAALLGQTPIPDGLDQSRFHSLCLATIRDLIARGFLVGGALQRA